ncbi:ribbon-helix-helix domain-containing protein [Spirulina major]|uniref:ribbon-helix-helix domain-containing protein n=1 Tax=Spirulina major TaxID=270636 RepID=UPI000932E582|nr:type II toxin-antitoxin system ParD family antitoxin [Spirulina major]
MKITINDQHQDFIAAQVASGKYANADEVVDLAVHLLAKLQGEYQDWIDETRAKVNEAIAELEGGEGLEGEMVMKHFREQFRRA